MHFEISAPTRVDLSGGTLDLWPLHFLVPAAKTINCAISLKMHVKLDLDPTRLQMVTLSDGKQNFEGALTEKKVPKPLLFPFHLVQSFFNTQQKWKGKLHLEWRSDIPPRSGLGGSSALAVAITKGLFELVGQKVDPDRILAFVKDAEAAFLKIPTGLQDYLAALHGGLCSYGFSYGKITQKRFGSAIETELEKRLLVLFSGENHDSGPSNWSIYKLAIDGNSNILKGLREISKITEQMEKELSTPQCDWKKVGTLMSKEWQVRRASFKVHTPTLDRIIKKISKLGILGIKVCGAAKGGCLVVLLDPQKRMKIEQGIEELGIQILRAKISRP